MGGWDGFARRVLLAVAILLVAVLAMVPGRAVPDAEGPGGREAAAACLLMDEQGGAAAARSAAQHARAAAAADRAWERLALRTAAYAVRSDDADRAETLRLCRQWLLLAP